MQEKWKLKDKIERERVRRGRRPQQQYMTKSGLMGEEFLRQGGSAFTDVRQITVDPAFVRLGGIQAVDEKLISQVSWHILSGQKW